jgi:type III pantothenate kinase
MILADVGNRSIHIYEDDSVVDLSLEDAIEYFSSQKLYYICVNSKADEKIQRYTIWENISEYIKLEGEYNGMGVDRKALCLSRGDGIYLDAGSAITIDKVKNGKYVGGMIFPGIYSYQKAYETISEKLLFDPEELNKMFQKNLPKETKKQIAFSILNPILESVKSMREDLPLYVTGGDRLLFASLIEDANMSNKFIFEGIIKSLEKNR